MAMLTPPGFIEETLAVVGEAPEATSGRISSVLTDFITRMSGSPSLVKGSVTHSLELEALGFLLKHQHQKD